MVRARPSDNDSVSSVEHLCKLQQRDTDWKRGTKASSCKGVVTIHNEMHNKIHGGKNHTHGCLSSSEKQRKKIK